MNSKKIFRGVLLAVLLAVFFGALVRSVRPEEVPEGRYCLGVRILPEEEMLSFREGTPGDYSENIMYQGEFAPVDQETSVIYLSQKISQGTRGEELKGSLTIDMPGTTLYFAPDENWNDLGRAAAKGHKFKLLVADHKKDYTQYDVVFTPLPVITMYGELLYKNSEARNVYSGQFRLWDPAANADGAPLLLSSRGHWHIRGQTAAGQYKSPWKISLKNMDGKNSSENLLNLGSDDDWILNAMNMEDTYIREKLFMDLWNEMAAQTDYNYHMSRGEYVEILVDGEYSGLYLLQRRVDGRYLELNNNELLAKGNWDGKQASYEMVSPALPDEVQTQILESFFYGNSVGNMDAENFVDVNLFMQFFCALDNQSYKNMFYLFDGPEGDYSLKLIPWDTDMAFGIRWVPETDGFTYDYDETLTSIAQRKEMDSMKAIHADLQQRMNDRWAQLRQGVLQEKRIFSQMEEYLSCLDQSGAVARNREKWGLYHEGADTLENMYRFIEERLMFLDEYYSQ